MERMDRRTFLTLAALACPVLLREQAKQKKRLAVISKDDCLACEVCIDACPVNALSLDEEEEIVKVDPELCTGCGDCVKECPVEAIEVKDVEVEAQDKVPPKKKEGLPQLDSESRAGGAEALAAFNIAGLWTITAQFAGDEKPVTANVRFTGTAAQGEMADGDTGEKQGTYTVKEGQIEFKFATGETARGRFVTADRMEGTLPEGGTWSAVRKS